MRQPTEKKVTKNNKKMRGIEKKGSETSNSIIRCHFGRSNVSHWGFGIQYRFRAVHHQNVHCMFIRIFFCSLCCLLSLSYQLKEEKKKKRTQFNQFGSDHFIRRFISFSDIFYLIDNLHSWEWRMKAKKKYNNNTTSMDFVNLIFLYNFLAWPLQCNHIVWLVIWTMNTWFGSILWSNMTIKRFKHNQTRQMNIYFCAYIYHSNL